MRRLKPEPQLESRYKDATVLAGVAVELMAARDTHPDMVNAHEGYAVILEELDELWQEIKVKQKNRDAAKLRKEAIQVAAMAVRFVADLL